MTKIIIIIIKKNLSKNIVFFSLMHLYLNSHEKTNNLGFPPGQTQTGLYSNRSRLEA